MPFFRTPVKAVALRQSTVVFIVFIQSTVVFIMISMQHLKECKKKAVIYRLFTSFISKISGLSSITFYADTRSGEFNCESSES